MTCRSVGVIADAQGRREQITKEGPANAGSHQNRVRAVPQGVLLGTGGGERDDGGGCRTHAAHDGRYQGSRQGCAEAGQELGSVRLAYGLVCACWSSLGTVLTRSLDVIRRNGWAEPTSIQAQAIPAIMSGRDVVGIAKTGSGKTVAFLLPLFRHVKDQRPVANNEGPIALILSPTRELATQIYREAKQFMGPMNVRVSSPATCRVSC